MTTAGFRLWLQRMLDRTDARGAGDAGDAWREIEAGDMLAEMGVLVAVDHIGHELLFGCADGILASHFETGIEGETVWPFEEGDVDANMRSVPPDHVAQALAGARASVRDLEALLGEC